MKGSIGAFALRFAAIAVLFAPAVAAQEQGKIQRVCRMVGYVHVCEARSGDVFDIRVRACARETGGNPQFFAIRSSPLGYFWRPKMPFSMRFDPTVLPGGGPFAAIRGIRAI
jgi:hypothetical protein